MYDLKTVLQYLDGHMIFITVLTLHALERTNQHTILDAAEAFKVAAGTPLIIIPCGYAHRVSAGIVRSCQSYFLIHGVITEGIKAG